MKSFFPLFGVIIIIASLSNRTATAGSPNSSSKPLQLSGPLGFIENKGQFFDENLKPRTDLLYLFERKGMKVQLMQNRISYELYTMQDDNNRFDESKGVPHYNELDPEDRPTPKLRYESSRVDVEFIGANPNPEITAEEMMPDYLNYYLTYAPKNNIKEVRQYNKITYKNLYPNIDLVFIATQDQKPKTSVSYDFLVHPGGNVKDIQYRYHGGNNQILYSSGNIETGTAQGKITEMIPESYLKNELGRKVLPVDVHFSLNKNIIGFTTGSYDKKQALVIDPMLVWATYCGGDSSEEGRGLGTDSLGNVALIGRSNSTNNIATTGAFQTQLAGNVDIILEKYDSAGRRLWGTYYGGTEDDHGRGLVSNKINNWYLGCHANSDGLATPGAYREHYAGGLGDDGLLAYFSIDGFIIFATYYGGTDDETIRRLTIDRDENVIMVGYTFSDTGIATPGVYQTQWKGNADLCLSKWSPDGKLIWGSYLGGTEEDHGRSVTVDKNDNIYVNGSTASPGIATPGVSRTTLADKQDYLLGAFTSAGQIIWVSYWGGAVEDRGRGVFVDSSSKYVYFTGYSASDTGVATPGAYQEHWVAGYDLHREPYHDMVLMKWTLDGHIVWSSYLGGAFDDRGRAITMIGDNEIYISGSTESPDTMSTPNGFQTVWGGSGDMFLEIWDSNGRRNYGTYFGGKGDEDNLALAIDDKHQNIYLVGTASSAGLGTPGTAQVDFGGDDDVMLVKIQVHAPATPPVAAFSYTNVPCTATDVLFSNNSSNADIYSWNFGDDSTSTLTSPIHTYDSAGNYTVTLISTNSTIGLSDTTVVIITVVSTPLFATVTPQGVTTFCHGQSVVLAANTGFDYSYRWKNGPVFISGATSSTYTATETGDYKVVITAAAGCSAISTIVHVEVMPGPTAYILEGATVGFCEGDSVVLTANADTVTYKWLNNNAEVPGATSAMLTVSATGIYAVVEMNSSGCSDTSLALMVSENPQATVNLGMDTTICDTASLTLDAGSGYRSYLWSTGASSQAIVVSAGNNYWVQVTDSNGCSGTDSIKVAVSICSGIADILNGSSFNIYPNPANGHFILSLSNATNEHIKVQLENILSQVVMDIYEGESGKNFTREVNASQLPSGVYNVKISMGNESLIRKLILDK
ncbi:MAG: SBBP repeat-containing protein [Chitinophagales bacterium]|nr:SBBP repeat-containing protein [Chitinophagales bacterium]